MSTAVKPGRAVAPPAQVRSLLEQPLAVVLLGFALSLALSWPRLLAIGQGNGFYDVDDAMRLVQVRDWLDGQGWYDLVEHRLDPPAGLLMHWSRIVDVPVAGLIRLFALFTTPDRAERLARIVFPLSLQIALLGTTIATARVLLGPRATLPAMILLVLTGFMFEQFPPGRIDHHAPQITLLMGMTGALLSALEAGRASRAAWAGVCIALSLAISLENLPFIAVIVAVLPLVWVIDPQRVRSALLWFAAALLVAVPALFALTVAPARWGDPVADALSIVHVVAVVGGALGLIGLAVLSGRLRRMGARLVAVGLVGAVVFVLLIAVFPAALHDPYAAMDPLLKSLWLSHVSEAQPLLVASRGHLDTLTTLGGPLLCGAAAAALATVRERGLDRVRWGAVLALTVVGVLGTLWEVRVASSAQPLAALGGSWAVVATLEAAHRSGSSMKAVLGFLLVLPMTTVGWALVPTGEEGAPVSPALASGEACRTAEALAPLAALPPGLVFAPIDDGSHLLVATPHGVIAAPYHRNGRGNRLVLGAFLARPAEAEAVVRSSGARYLAICPGEAQVGTMAMAAPAGLAADLAAGEVPAWLEPLPLQTTPYRVFTLRSGAR